MSFPQNEILQRKTQSALGSRMASCIAKKLHIPNLIYMCFSLIGLVFRILKGVDIRLCAESLPDTFSYDISK